MTLFISPTELNEPKAVYVFLWWTGEAGGGIIMNDLYLKSLRAKIVSSLFDRRELRQIFCEKRWVQKYLSLLTWREKNLFFVAMKCSLRFDKFLSPFILIVNWGSLREGQQWENLCWCVCIVCVSLPIEELTFVDFKTDLKREIN